MKLFKKLMAGVVLAAAAASAANASTINLGGVFIDPDDSTDFSGTTATVSQYITVGTGELTGFGKITKLNESETFCPGCELTFQFGGYMPVSAGLLPTTSNVGISIDYTGGWVKVFVDHTPDAPSNAFNLNAGNAADGNLWLDMVGHAINGVTLTGLNFFPAFLHGQGWWDVVGGIAKGNLDTNSKDDGSDLAFSMTFTSFGGPTVNPLLVSSGAGTFKGNSIPEPGSLLLLSLGLLGIATARARKNS